MEASIVQNYSWQWAANAPLNEFHSNFSNKLLCALTNECEEDFNYTLESYVKPILTQISNLPFDALKECKEGVCCFFKAVTEWEDNDCVHLTQLIGIYLKALYNNEDELVQATSVLMHSSLTEYVNKLQLSQQYLQTQDEKLLMVLAEEGKIEEILNLIGKGVNVNTCDPLGLTPLHIACIAGQIKVAEALLGSGKVKIDQKDLKGSTPLMYAASWDLIDMISLLINSGASIETKDNEGLTAVIYACVNGKLSALKVLESRGADLHSEDNYGNNGLDYSYTVEFEEALNFFKSKDLLPNIRTKLFMAFDREDREQIDSLLMKVDLDTINLDDLKDLIEKAFGSGDLTMFKKLWRPDLNANDYLASCIMNEWESLYDFLKEKGADINHKVNGVTHLHYFCRIGDARLAAIANKWGADVNVQDDHNGGTALIWATLENHFDVVKYLTDKGADLNIRDRVEENTALMWAISKKHIDTADYLIDMGADLQLSNIDGKTAFEMAVESGDMKNLVVKMTAKLFPEG